MRLKKSSIAVLAALTMVIAGCSHGLGGRMSGDGTAASTVTFSVTDIPPEYNDMINQARNPATRSILPNAPFDFSSGLNFVLTGTSNSGKKIDPTPVSVPNSPPYTFSVDLDPYVWDLTLTAYKGPVADNKKALIGHCTIDLTKGNGAATFQMSIKGLTTPGTVKITGSVTDTDLICDSYEIGIYNLYSGELVTEYTDPATTPPATRQSNAQQSYDTESPHVTPSRFHYGDTSVTPTPDPVVTLNAGAYEYRMVFYKGTGLNKTPIGSYSDTIVVYPANDLEKSLGEIDVLNRKPTKPENLRAYLEDKSEDKDPNYYYVKLTWDPSRFETNYELKVQTSSDDGTTFSSADDKIYGFKATNSTAEDFLASSIWHDGSLAYGSKTCTIKLQLGKVYEVSLQARNYIGVSDWVERLTATTPAPAITGHTYFEAAAGKHINRRRIHYDLNQGTLKLDAGVPSTPQNTFTVEYSGYDSYDGTPKPLPLLHIQPSTTTPLAGVTTLTRPGATPPTVIEWRKWLNQDGGAEVTAALPIPPTPITGIYKHENVFLKADFGFGLEGTVTITGPQDIPTNKLKITYDEEHGTTNTPISPMSSNPKHYSVPKLTNTKATWITVQFDGLASPADYDNLHCTAYFAPGAGLISKVDLQATGNICKFSTGDYTPQTFTLKVMAEETATHQMRSQTYIIELH